MIGHCGFVLADLSDFCGRRALRAVSARHTSSGEWIEYPVCVRHGEILPAELADFGYVVTERYALGDQVGRDACRAVEAVASDPYEFAAAFDPYFVPVPDDLGWDR